jgi:D-alanyl-lipoteichoic acid acyltransferase DltB (MBOAT superfamily)
LIENKPLPSSIKRLIDKHELIKILATGFVFGLAVLLVKLLGLENKTFLYSLILACVGFPIHHLLPKSLKLPFFVLISFGSIGLALGIVNGIWLIGLGSLFIILAHLPLPFWVRITGQTLLGAVLIVYRANLFPSFIPSVIWPILGSMFIFRLIIYMYDLKAKTTAFGPWRALAYFFMVPNVNFTLLPVIDYKNLFSVYYPKNKQSFEIYQKGIVLLVRGIIHLLLYRFIYQNVLVDPITIESASEAGQYMVGTFLLYLRISGYFHMFSGILHMYGFNLPETHHLYFLASSFTDFWRRINIFWKDFMQKIFFYPVHFWLSKRMGTLTAVSLATIYAFLITWFLHSYQWFWIRGDFKLSAQDALFWGSLGVVVLINLIWELKFPKKRSLKAPKRTWKSELILATKTILTFVCIVFIWNVWSTPDFAEFKGILAAFTHFGLKDLLNFSTFFIILGGLAVLYGHKTRGDNNLFSFGNKKKTSNIQTEFWQTTAKTCGIALLLLYLGNYPTSVPGGESFVATVVRLTTNELNERDSKLLQRGYYEDLTDVARFNPELQALYNNKPANWKINPLIVQTPGKFPPYRLTPSKSGEFKKAKVTTNQWGFRDHEYTKSKPENTYRLALVGASHSFGSGVNNDETYESILELKVKKELASLNLGDFESFNFSLGGYGPGSKISMLEDKGLEMAVDGFLYIVIDDFNWASRKISHVYRDSNDGYDFEPIRKIVEQAGVTYGMEKTETELRLKKHLPEITRYYYSYLLNLAKQNNIDLWIAFIPIPEDQSKVRKDIEAQMVIAKELGINTIDITDTYTTVKKHSTLWVAPWDRHPDPKGHQLLADKMFKELRLPLIQTIKTKREQYNNLENN